jgi:hypothetical protein
MGSFASFAAVQFNAEEEADHPEYSSNVRNTKRLEQVAKVELRLLLGRAPSPMPNTVSWCF